ncbi:hypothetical protein RvY_07360-2 [Ramazzottius varieornatus]|uniref:Uncharacterized protein n=1 Tax=Ramazzottius varieornatus TaxID=947166 RepID=A0A1D1V506_RAMVA|nr:hypothetical protein RvY_07360-2 [Ramazzottius varieornatus]
MVVDNFVLHRKPVRSRSLDLQTFKALASNKSIKTESTHNFRRPLCLQDVLVSSPNIFSISSVGGMLVTCLQSLTFRRDGQIENFEQRSGSLLKVTSQLW